MFFHGKKIVLRIARPRPLWLNLCNILLDIVYTMVYNDANCNIRGQSGADPGERRDIVEMETAMLITNDTDGEYGHITVSMVAFEDGAPRNIGDWENTGFADLLISCQMDDHTDKSYAWKCEYKPFTVGLNRAVAMAKMLKKIERKRNKMNEIRGYERTFSQYMGRIAEILKIKTFLWKVKGDSPLYSHNEYSVNDLQTAIYHVDKLESDTIEKLS